MSQESASGKLAQPDNHMKSRRSERERCYSGMPGVGWICDPANCGKERRRNLTSALEDSGKLWKGKKKGHRD
eukprot:12906777-Prorocentrum_lima.AAC.1